MFPLDFKEIIDLYAKAAIFAVILLPILVNIIRYLSTRRENKIYSSDIKLIVRYYGWFGNFMIALNYRLLNSVREYIKKYSFEKKIEKSIVGLLLAHKAKQCTQARLILIFSILGYGIITSLFEKYYKFELVLVQFVILVAIYIYEKLLGYRLRKGYYGTNDQEAREILKFVFENAEKYDFYGDGGIPILSEPEVEHSPNFSYDGETVY